MLRKERVAVALSGGVDSAVAASLLKDQGYQVLGYHLCLRRNGAEETEDQAEAVAQALGIPFLALHWEREFRELIIEPYCQSYLEGETPNPCVWCNARVKFGLLYLRSLKDGCQRLATGHYAQVKKSRSFGASFTYNISRGKDRKKDQSYFLWKIESEYLPNIIFPVGGMSKERVRSYARVHNLPVCSRPESQGVCFLGGSDYRDFLQRKTPNKIKPGLVRDLSGTVIGSHQGVGLYTVGQRHGFSVDPHLNSTAQAGVPLYVLKLVPALNEIIVGREEPAPKKPFGVEEINWLDKSCQESFSKGDRLEAEVQIRYLSLPFRATVTKVSARKALVASSEPLRSLTPGQSAVFYRGAQLLGGGVILPSSP